MPETKSSVPAVIDSRAKLAPVYVPPLGYNEAAEDKPGEPVLRYVWAVRRQGWKILLFVAVSALVTLLLSKRLTPIYESTATIDVDRQLPQGIIGQDSPRQSLDDTEKYLATQIKLIQSDSVLRPIALKYNLLGQERQNGNSAKRRALERAEAPVVLKKLKVTRPPNTYLLEISYRSADPRLAADVANAIAASYIEHTFDIRLRSSADFSSFIEKRLQALKAKMEKSRIALARFEHDSRIVNPDESIAILSARLSKLSSEYTNAQADRVLKAARYNAAKMGSLEGSELSNQGVAFESLTDRLNRANERFADVKARFGVNRREYKRPAALVTQLTKQLDRLRRSITKRLQIQYLQATGRERMVGKEVAAAKAELDRMKADSSEFKSLQRQAEADKSLYQEFGQKIREPAINAPFQESPIRLADSARPALQPVFPKIGLNVLLACLFASILAIIVAIVSELFDDTFRNPEQAHGILDANIIGILPIARSRSILLAPSKDRSGASMRWQDANDKRAAAYVEAVEHFVMRSPSAAWIGASSPFS